MSGITLLVNWKCKGNWHSRKVCVSPHSQYLEGTTVFALNLSYTLYVLLQSRAHKFFYRELPLITIIVSLTFLSTHTVVNLLIWIKKYLKLRQKWTKNNANEDIRKGPLVVYELIRRKSFVFCSWKFMLERNEKYFCCFLCLSLIFSYKCMVFIYPLYFIVKKES